MKKLLLLITAVLFNVASAFAQDCDYSGETGLLNWCLKNGTLTISGNGEMPHYNSWDTPAPWFDYQELIAIVVIETGVTSIGNSAFELCTSLTSITIPNSVTWIGDFAFSGCTSMTSITIPISVIRINYCTFSGCTSLVSVTIPGSVTEIVCLAFAYCTSLTTIAIPNSVTTIQSEAFSGCTSLTTIDVESENSVYDSENGVLFNKDKTTIIYYPLGKIGAYVIPGSVKEIGVCAFWRCDNLTSITIPGSVINIEEGAFAYCTSLTSITNLNLIPVEIIFSVFSGVNQSKCTLKVPTSAVSAYQNADVWKEFNIVGGGILVNPVSSNSEYGYTTGNGLYEGGGKSIATITATAFSGYKFVNWTKNSEVVSTDNPYSFTVTEDVELVANFEEGVGIDDLQFAIYDLWIYPNPTTGELRMESGELRIKGVEVFDIYGRKCHSSPVTCHYINISALPVGIYFLKIRTEAGEVVKKVVKE